MSISKEQAYRLGSMPRRCWRVRSKPRWPEDDTYEEAVGLVDEWLALLDRIKGKPLKHEVEALRAVLNTEHQVHERDLQHSKRMKLHELLSLAGHDLEAPTPPQTHLPDVDSSQLMGELIERAKTSRLPEALPAYCHDAYELGQLVAEGIYNGPDEAQAQRIADLVRQHASEQWLTGNLAPHTQGCSIHTIVSKRIFDLDELLSTLPWPSSNTISADEETDTAYLTIAEAAGLLKIGEATVERLIANGELPTVEISGRGISGGRKVRRIMRESLDAWMKQQERKQPPTPRRRRRGSDAHEDLIGD